MPFSPLEFFSLGKNGKMGRWIHGSPRYQSYLIVIIGSHLYCTNRYTSRTFLSGSSLVGIRSVEMHARGILTLLAHLLYSVFLISCISVHLLLVSEMIDCPDVGRKPTVESPLHPIPVILVPNRIQQCHCSYDYQSRYLRYLTDYYRMRSHRCYVIPHLLGTGVIRRDTP
jgi:hypothetical protein